MTIRCGTAGGTDIEIGGKLVIHPGDNGLAKTADHNADGDHHGDGGGKRRDQDRSAIERCGEAARGEESLDAEKSLERLRGEKRQEATKAGIA